MFVSGLILIISLIYRYIQWQWISLALGVAGVCIIVACIVDKDKIMRVGGLLLFGLTLMRVIFVDLSYLDTIFKIISFIIIGGIFLIVSYIYNNYVAEITDMTKK